MFSRPISLVAFFVAALLAAAFVIPHPLHAADDEMTAKAANAANELRIMAKVLEASLDQSNLKDWHMVRAPMSLFDSKIRAQYVPTVGAFFEIDVRFPLNAPPEPKKDEEPAAGESSDDLWNKFSKESRHPAITVVPARLPGGRTVIRSEEHSRELKRSSGGINLGQGGNASGGGGGGGGGFGGGGGGGFGGGGGGGGGGFGGGGGGGFGGGGGWGGAYSAFGAGPQEYNPEKVQTLRNALIEALAKYGHRMESLAAEDRVLILVTGPKIGAIGAAASYSTTIVNSSGESTVVDLESMPFFAGLDGGTAPRDHLLLTIEKRQLKTETTPEDLKKHVKELAY